MSLETINSVDINFSNGGGQHTANVTSIVDVKNSDGSPALGVVNGEIGSKNYFSQDEINQIMSRFICTSVNKSKSPNFKSIKSIVIEITIRVTKSASTPTAPLPKTSDNASTSLVNLVNNLPTGILS